jgi:hypothetical protein
MAEENFLRNAPVYHHHQSSPPPIADRPAFCFLLKVQRRKNNIN